jgi:hypothetical protein
MKKTDKQFNEFIVIEICNKGAVLEKEVFKPTGTG